MREGGERRSPASPRGAARFFCCAVGRFLEGRAQCSDEAFGTSGVPLVCRIGGARPLLEGGERRAPASPQGWRGSFAARLGVFLKVERSVPMERLGRAGCRLFAESEVSAIARRRGASLPCIPSRGGEVLLLCCWAFLLRVKRVSLLMTSWMLLVCKLEVCDRRARAGSVAPLHPLKRQRDSFAVRLDVSIEGRACWFAFDELDVACLQNRRCVAVARGRGASLPCIPSRGGEFFCCAVGRFY